MTDLAYLNGEFVPLSEAKISIEDRGYAFADGIYEVVMAYGGKPFKLSEHLDRLERSAAAIRLSLPMDRAETTQVVGEGIQRSGFTDCMIYIQVTRGVAPREHEIPQNVQPTFLATFRARPEVPPDVREEGVSLITTEEVRWAKCYIKSIALLPNVLAKQQAVDAGAYEAVFVSPEGEVHEGSSTNIFMVKEGCVLTPPKTEQILHGITRDTVLECARNSGFEVVEQTIRVADLFQADELFLSGTTTEVLGAVRLDGKPIGSGTVGPVTKKLHELFRELVRREA